MFSAKKTCKYCNKSRNDTHPWRCKRVIFVYRASFVLHQIIESLLERREVCILRDARLCYCEVPQEIFKQRILFINRLDFSTIVVAVRSVDLRPDNKDYQKLSYILELLLREEGGTEGGGGGSVSQSLRVFDQSRGVDWRPTLCPHSTWERTGRGRHWGRS